MKGWTAGRVGGRVAAALVLGVALSLVPTTLDTATTPTDVRSATVTNTTLPPTTQPTAPTPPPPPPPEPVTLAFTGDVHFEGPLANRLAADPEGVLAAAAPVLAAADLAVVNLETAITERGTPEPKQFTFRAPESAFAALAAAGVDVAGMANNHGLDFGAVGLEDTLAAAARAPVAVIGIGRTATDALRPFSADVGGWRIAVFAATDVLDDELEAAWTARDDHPGLASAKDPGRLVEGIRAARAFHDTVVVLLHWGTEGQTCPSDRQRRLAATLRDAGADVVVGSHAHRLQGAGHLGDAFVAYGLGNFAFDAGSAAGRSTGVLEVTVAGRDVPTYRWVPMRITEADGAPRPLDPPAAEAELVAWEGLRACTDLTA